MNTQTNRLDTKVNQTVILHWKQTTKQQQQKKKYKNNPNRGVRRPGGWNGCGYLTVKRNSMYDSKNDSNMYSSLKLNIYRF